VRTPHAVPLQLLGACARASVETLSDTSNEVVHGRSIYNKKGPSTNTFMSIWGTSYFTTMRFPKDLAPVP
jgi:hypothetical protein